LSPFSATIVQNSGNSRNDWNFATKGCMRAAGIDLSGWNNSRKKKSKMQVLLLSAIAGIQRAGIIPLVECIIVDSQTGGNLIST
jgi:hypothetical protein